MANNQRYPWWTVVLPLAAWAAYVLIKPEALGGAGSAVLFAALIGAVFAAVHHAEVIAHRVGEPFGTLVLAIAVTVIETALIVSIMLSADGGKATLARDAVFAAVMIVLNGVVGLCVVVGGARHREQGFQVLGAASYLGVLVTLAALSLVLPVYTLSAPGPVFTPAQLIFVSISALILYGVFLFVQTIRHRDYFLPPVHADDEAAHAAPPSNRATLGSVLVLPLGLGAVVWIAKDIAPSLEAGVGLLGVADPAAVVGAMVAGLVLLPESLAAVAAARRNRLQTSLNLALGSGLATIALTIPAVALVTLYLGQPLILGLEEKELVLLAVTFLVSTITLASGRTTVLQGAVHLVIFAAFCFLLIAP
jgi:Ca2+:H+ antiporter